MFYKTKPKLQNMILLSNLRTKWFLQIQVNFCGVEGKENLV